MDKHMMAVGNQDGFTAIACPKCDSAMKKMDGGYSESLERGEYIQREHPEYWKCTNKECGHKMNINEPKPMTEEEWEAVFADRPLPQVEF